MKKNLALKLFFSTFVALAAGCTNVGPNVANTEPGYVVSHSPNYGKAAASGQPYLVGNEEDRENYFYGRYGLY